MTLAPETKGDEIILSPPLYLELMHKMGFDPEGEVSISHWKPWLLDEKYPLSLGELMLSVRQPEGVNDDTGSGGGSAASSSRSGSTVSSQPEDGDPMGQGGQAGVD